MQWINIKQDYKTIIITIWNLTPYGMKKICKSIWENIYHLIFFISISLLTVAFGSRCLDIFLLFKILSRNWQKKNYMKVIYKSDACIKCLYTIHVEKYVFLIRILPRKKNVEMSWFLLVIFWYFVLEHFKVIHKSHACIKCLSTCRESVFY